MKLSWLWGIAVVVAAVCGSTASWAQKIGYVSTDAIRAQYEANKQAEERLNALVEEWKQELAKRQTDIDELELEMRKNRLIWSDAERTTKEKELETKRQDRDKYARDKFEPGGEHDKTAEQLFKGIWTKIYASIQKVAAAEGYDIVWDKSTQPLVYVNAKYDLTVKVMKELGIDAGDLERKQADIISNDPRNKRAEEPRRRKARRTTTTEPEQTDEQPVENAEKPKPRVHAPNGIPPGSVPIMPSPPVLDTTTTKTDTTKPKEEDIPR